MGGNTAVRYSGWYGPVARPEPARESEPAAQANRNRAAHTSGHVRARAPNAAKCSDRLYRHRPPAEQKLPLRCGIGPVVLENVLREICSIVITSICRLAFSEVPHERVEFRTFRYR